MVPLRIASGIINKVLEPMAMGVAVVASCSPSPGWMFRARDVVLIADDADQYAAAIGRLVRDDGLYARLTTAAHDYVQRSHAWTALLTQYRERIECAAGLS